MKHKKTIIVMAFLPIILSACQTKNYKAHEDRFDNNPNLRNDLEMYEEHESRNLPDCHSLCYDKVQEICVDEIVAILEEGDVHENSIFDEEHCASQCESKWNDDTRECVGNASQCDSLLQSEPYCREEEDNSIVEFEEEAEQKLICSKACYKYKRCALMADDATNKDGNEAYRSCYVECQKWSDDTIECVNKTETATPMGCANLSACALKEYQGLLR